MLTQASFMCFLGPSTPLNHSCAPLSLSLSYVLSLGVVAISVTVRFVLLDPTVPNPSEGGRQYFTMTTEQDVEKWKGSVSEVVSAPLDKVWEILADFDGLKKNFPDMFCSCETVEGEKNKVGSLRVISIPLSDGSTFEARERLLVIDNEKHIVSYTVEDNFILIGYKVDFTVEASGDDKTRVVYHFETNPSGFLTESLFLSQQKGKLQKVLASIGQRFSK